MFYSHIWLNFPINDCHFLKHLPMGGCSICFWANFYNVMTKNFGNFRQTLETTKLWKKKAGC
jgi:hypothetical protein